MLYPLNEIKNRINKLLDDSDQQNETLDMIEQRSTWLMDFAKRMEPKVKQIEIYAQLIPEYQSIITDLKLEIERLRQRQRNTALPYGTIIEIRPKANPPIVIIVDAGNEFEIWIPQPLFDQQDLQIGMWIEVEARMRLHSIPRRKDRVVFYAFNIREINPGTVDKNFEDRYNDN